MKGIIVVIVVYLLVVICLCSPIANADSTTILERKQNFIVYRDTLTDGTGLIGSDFGYVMHSGETLFVSWKTTETIFPDPIVWLLTQQQKDHWNFAAGGAILSPYGYLLKKSGHQASFTFTAQQDATYYVVIHNIAWGALDISGPTLNVEAYEADLTIPSAPSNPTQPTNPSVGGTWSPITNLDLFNHWESLVFLMIALITLVVCVQKSHNFLNASHHR
ncbi:MAG: hypothetical protein ABSD73_03250 [Candidatus Bathyarchaeia archaeon]